MRVREIKVFLIFMEVSIQTWIARRLQMSPIVYNDLQSTVEFKVDMHNLYIWVRKDPKRTWFKLPFIATYDAIFEVLAAWPLKWRAIDKAALERMAEQ